jgi:hypothetical protein
VERKPELEPQERKWKVEAKTACSCCGGKNLFLIDVSLSSSGRCRICSFEEHYEFPLQEETVGVI